MSAEDREALATAASTVDGVNVSAYYRQSTKPGDGCVRLAASNPAENGVGRVNTWEVWLVLPQDQKQAEVWMDANLADLIEALDPEFIAGVQAVTPSELVLEAGATNGLVISGNREQ